MLDAVGSDATDASFFACCCQCLTDVADRLAWISSVLNNVIPIEETIPPPQMSHESCRDPMRLSVFAGLLFIIAAPPPNFLIEIKPRSILTLRARRVADSAGSRSSVELAQCQACSMLGALLSPELPEHRGELISCEPVRPRLCLGRQPDVRNLRQPRTAVIQGRPHRRKLAPDC